MEGSRQPDEDLLDRLFGPVEEIETEAARQEEVVSRGRARGLRYGGYGMPRPAVTQHIEIVDDWEANEVGND